MAAGGPLRRVGDTLRSPASEPTGDPAGDAVPSVLLQHLQGRQKKKMLPCDSVKAATLPPNVWKDIDGINLVLLMNSPLGLFIIHHYARFATSLFLEAFSRTKLHFIEMNSKTTTLA